MTSSVLLILVAGRTMAPDNAHILIPIICEYIAKRTLQMDVLGDGRVPWITQVGPMSSQGPYQ